MKVFGKIVDLLAEMNQRSTESIEALRRAAEETSQRSNRQIALAELHEFAEHGIRNLKAIQKEAVRLLEEEAHN